MGNGKQRARATPCALQERAGQRVGSGDRIFVDGTNAGLEDFWDGDLQPCRIQRSALAVVLKRMASRERPILRQGSRPHANVALQRTFRRTSLVEFSVRPGRSVSFAETFPICVR